MFSMQTHLLLAPVFGDHASVLRPARLSPIPQVSSLQKEIQCVLILRSNHSSVKLSEISFLPKVSFCETPPPQNEVLYKPYD